MGQAKNRGTFEQRQAAAIARIEAEQKAQAEAELEARRKDQEWLDSLPPEVRDRELQRRRVESLRRSSFRTALAGLMAASALSGVKSPDIL